MCRVVYISTLCKRGGSSGACGQGFTQNGWYAQFPEYCTQCMVLWILVSCVCVCVIVVSILWDL